MAVIDDERDAAMLGQMARNGRRRFVPRRRILLHFAVGREAQTVAVDRNPALLAADPLPDWQSIEELVGGQQQRGGRQILDPLVPNGIRHLLGLSLPQARAGFDQMDRAAETRPCRITRKASAASVPRPGPSSA